MASPYFGTDWTGFASMMVPPNGLSTAPPNFFSYGSNGDSSDASHHGINGTSTLNGSNNFPNFMTAGSPIDQKMPLSTLNPTNNNNNNGGGGNGISMADSMSAIKQQFDWSSDPASAGIYGNFNGAATHPMMMHHHASNLIGHDPTSYLNYPSTSLSNNLYNNYPYPQISAALDSGSYYSPSASEYLQNSLVSTWKTAALSTRDHKPSLGRSSGINNLGGIRKLPHKTGPGTNNVRVRTQDTYRTVYSDRQRVELEKEFHCSQFINAGRKAELAGQLDLTERQIKIWFQNRRAKKRKQHPK